MKLELTANEKSQTPVVKLGIWDFLYLVSQYF